MKLKPLGDRLIVRAIEEEETTASGIVLPDTAKEKPQRGEVIAVGDGRYDDDGDKRIPLDVSMDDVVTVVRFSQIVDSPTELTDRKLGIGGAQN